MNPQNPNDYNQQPQGNYPAAPNQPQGPQVYGPQQYYPMPVSDGGTPGQAPKTNKKLIIGVAILLVLLVVTVVVAVLLNSSGGGNGELSGDKKVERTYDSPVGLMPGMQAADIKSGKFKLTASYVTGGDFTREGAFTVEDGHMHFEMVADDARVNVLMKNLYERGRTKTAFDPAKHGVDRNLSYDFASMLGYHYLYDVNGSENSGFIPAVEAAKASAKPDKLYTLTTSCDSALAEVKKLTDMVTTDLVFEMTPEGVNKTQAVVSFSTRQAIDKAVHAFFDSCFDLNSSRAAKVKGFVDGLREDVTPSPTFTFWQEENTNFLEVSAPEQDRFFGGGMHFELTELSDAPAESSGATGSYVERRNQFGLAYSLCRVDPVITTTEGAGYRFLREDPGYDYPKASHTGYYCTTLSVPTQFKPVSSLTLKTTTGAASSVTGSAVDGLRGLHDLVFEVEKFNISNKRYPGTVEFRDIANSNMGALTAVTQTIFTNKSLVYTPAPEECVGTCNDYVLSYVPAANVQVQRTTYTP